MNITLVKPALSGLLLVVALGIACSTASAFEKGSLVQKKCIVCHAAENGKLARVEDLRTTPEEWTVIVDRMRRLYGMKIKAGEMAILLKELCTTQILSPDEAAQVSYISLFNNPQTIEAPDGVDEEQLFATCVRCHSSAKIHSYRMTETAWAKLRDFHIYIDPAIMFQMREMHWRSEADDVLRGLAQKLPYKKAWTIPESKPDGEWFVLGVEPGKGNYRGKATLKSQGGDEYGLQGVLSFSDGTFESFSGEGTLYGGYALRTRTSQNGSSTMGAFSFLDGVISGEHHHNGPDFRTSSSIWYPITNNSQALRITPAYLLGGEETTILIEGINLPEVSAKDISVSDAEVEVLQATTSSPESIEVVLVYRGSGHGTTGVSVKGLAADSRTLNVKLAPRIDYLSVSPAMGRARVNGGINYPAEGVQFQAFAWSRSADADNPSDDILLGPVAADFSLAEEISRPGDDDLVYMGVIEANGRYLPIGNYQPIPAREYGGEGTGMVKVIAEYTRGEVPYTAEGRLVVTVPDYIQRLR
jgi:quinohemoprotein amine dehydrogenase